MSRPTIFLRDEHGITSRNPEAAWVFEGFGVATDPDAKQTFGLADAIHCPELTYDSIQRWFACHPEVIGILWHHSDGREAQIMREDFEGKT